MTTVMVLVLSGGEVVLERGDRVEVNVSVSY